MALLIYNLLLILLTPIILPYLLWRLANGKEDRDHWGERWGTYPPDLAQDTRSPRIWLHAVSVGEAMAAVPVVRELRKRYPDALLVVSTITPAGREVARQRFEAQADAIVYFPLDYPLAVNAALASVRPDLVLLMEWEIWPNFLQAAKRRHGATIAVLNGRVSDRGLRRGSRGRFFTGPGLAAVDLFAMQSAEDARRAALVGADPAKVVTTGNTKFDESERMLAPEERAALRADLGIPAGVPVLLCGSTRNAPSDSGGPDEEVLVAEAITRIRERFPDLFVIVAPRHLERADAVAAILEGAGMRVRRRSEGAEGPHLRAPGGYPGVRAAPSDANTLLLDTFGELGRAYAVADVAFVGGSLVRQGGQSAFQPLAQGVPALFGPYMNNQRDIAALSAAEGVGFPVADAAGLAAEVIRLLSLPDAEREEMAAKARALIDRNQGVTVQTLDAVEAAWRRK